MEIFRAKRRKYDPTLTREEPHRIGTGKGHKLTFALTAIMGDLQEAHTERRERSTEKEQLTIGSLFDGIGGFPYNGKYKAGESQSNR